MKCNDTSKLIIDKLAGELSPRQANKLKKHLAACDACRKEAEMLYKAWQFSSDTLKTDSFAKKLSPKRRSEILDIAQHEEKRQRSSRVMNRIVEYFAVIMICLVLAGMMLPALNQAREKSRRISAQSRLKMAQLAKLQAEMDQEEADNDSGITEDKGEIASEAVHLVLKAPPAKKSKAKYTPPRQSYYDKIRAKLAGATNTLGGSVKDEKRATPKPAAKETFGEIQTVPVARKKDAWKRLPKLIHDEPAPSDSSHSRTITVESNWRIKEKRAKSAVDTSKKILAPQTITVGRNISASSSVAWTQKIQAPIANKQRVYRIAGTKRKEPEMALSYEIKTVDDTELVMKKNQLAVLRHRHADTNPKVKKLETEIAELQKKASAPESTSKAACGNVVYDRVIPLRKESFKLNLKLWNMTTVANVRKYLQENKYPVPSAIKVYKNQNMILIQDSKETLGKIEKLFKKLQDEEKELKDLSKGLPFIKCLSRPVSTFSIDTDTASYVQARKSIRRGERPDPLKIRPEEFINYFDYNYRSPVNATFAVYPEAAPSPFRPNNTLFRIGIQGKRLGPGANTRTHYTILLDTSGSMAVKDRMELAKKALEMLLKKLKSSDYISLLLCGSDTKVVFRMRALTPENRQKLLRILNSVTPRSVADFARGISQAYAFADRYYLRDSSNRVIIISDGIFELNAAGRQNITKQIEAARKRGISNIVIGLGGDGDDNMLEKVASTGDGSYVFLDTEREARELFSTRFEARFREIARDVKIQVQFNPEAVKSYRQIGYKNRQLSKADFRNDKVDAGEVGSGQSVTALYELDLKYGIPKDTIVATVRIRYKKAGDMSVEEKAFYLYESDIKDKFSAAGANFKLAAFVAEFAECLRYPETQGIASLRGIADRLNGLWMKDYRKDYKVSELLSLIKRSK